MGKIDVRNLDDYKDDQPNTQKIRKGQKRFKDDDRQNKKKK